MFKILLQVAYNINNTFICYIQVTADFDDWYPENEHSFCDKFPLLKSKLISATKTSSRQTPFVGELKQLAQGESCWYRMLHITYIT